MIVLPKEFLDEVYYYECSVSDGGAHGNAYYTKFTFHFKKWWKLRKVDWVRTKIEGSYSMWHEGADSLQLRQQLVEYFTNRNKSA